MPIKWFLTSLILKLRNFSASNALGFFFGLSGGAILYYLDSRQIINLLPIAQYCMDILCVIGIECIQQTTTSINLDTNSSMNSQFTNALVVNAFISATSLVISWIVTELYETFGKKNKSIQKWELNAKILKEKLTHFEDQNNSDSKSPKSSKNSKQLDLFQNKGE